ncbi:MAG: hypothetical protein Q3982_05825 [Phoenicibacter congonensis]|uniref:Uncharacterized protein n=1 Tax=Phoenicibacter congonensis TaxID=1944646 RepID=A0AA43RI08_9ACTN|nr:hypothetical protein [Phoenicibacter congonensis]
MTASAEFVRKLVLRCDSAPQSPAVGEVHSEHVAADVLHDAVREYRKTILVVEAYARRERIYALLDRHRRQARSLPLLYPREQEQPDYHQCRDYAHQQGGGYVEYLVFESLGAVGGKEEHEQRYRKKSRRERLFHFQHYSFIFTEDGRALTTFALPEDMPKEELDELLASGEMKLYDDSTMILEEKAWKEEDGKLFYDTEAKAEVLGEKLSSWVSIKQTADGIELLMYRLVKE